MTKKDALIILAGLTALVLAGIPVYFNMLQQYRQYQCEHNFHAISTAITSYMTQYDDRLPPLFARQSDTAMPRLDSSGRPYTWASTLVNVAGFDPKRSFECPAATPGEKLLGEGLNGTDLPMTYGMYAAMDTIPKASVPDSANSVIVIETANGGANSTYDPSPLMPGGVGSPARDGFLVGWKTGDLQIPQDPAVLRPSVTRLAFKNSSHGVTAETNIGRHNISIFALFIDGHVRLLKSREVTLPKYWRLPPH